MKQVKLKTCMNCIRGHRIAVNNDILCSINGAVSADYVCSKHKLAPEPKTYKDMELKCAQCESFIHSINSKDSTSLGYCHLFTVRKFDGNLKSACSKFSKRKEAEVS